MEIQCSAKALLRRKSDGKYLILTSSEWEENPRRSQAPDLPGGLIEAGETIEEGLSRELEEEIGTGIRDGLQLAYAMTYVNDAQTKSTTFMLFFAETDDIEIKLSWEHESYEWLTADEIRNLEIRNPYPTIISHFTKIGLLV